MFNSNSMRNNGGGGGSNINVIDNLNSTSGTDALSARQGGILAEQDRLLSEKVDQNKAEIELKLQQQSSKIASETELGNVKIDNKTIKITPDGTIYAETTSQNSIFEIHELILPTTQIGQSEWIIPNEYYTSGDTVIVSHNSTVLDSTMYTLSESGGVVKVTIQNTTDLPIDKNSVYLVIFHNKIPDPQFTIYDKTLLTNIVSQKTWTIDTPNFDSTKDSVLVIYNTTLLSNNEYTIVGDKLTLLIETNEAIDKNTVSVFVFSNSRPLGGNYTLPIATKNTLGGIKPDGVTLSVDPLTGIASVISSNGGSLNFKQQLLITTQNSQQTWDIPFTNFDKDKDLLIVTHNTTVIPTDKYSITTEGSTQKLNLLFTTPNEIQDNNVFLIMIKGGTSEGSSINLPISANDVTETPNKVYVTSNQRAQIDSNTLENASQTTRISNLENTLSSIVTTDEKVKMNSSGEAKYLQELLDGITIINSNGKLTVQGINNLIATINELNFLQGATSNIQQQINNISGVSTFRGVFNSLVDLQSAPNPQAGEYAIVSENGTSDYYFYYGNNWDFSHSSVGVTTVDINSNTTGTLSKSRYEKQSAEETPFLDVSGNIKSTNTNQAIVEVFQFADSLLTELKRTVGSPLKPSDNLEQSIINIKLWWSNLTNAVSNKGVPTSTSNNGDEIIQKISIIPNINIEGTIKKKSKLNLVAPYDIEILLENSLSLSDITTTLIEFVRGATGIVHYNLDFNNGDSSNFEPNNYLEYNGILKLKKLYEEALVEKENSFQNDYLYTISVHVDNFKDILSLEVI